MDIPRYVSVEGIEAMTWRVLLALVCSASIAEAGPFRLFKPVPRPTNRSTTSGGNLTAYESASISAQQGRMAHRGGTYAFEGVGFSSASPDAALRNCCFYGQKAIVESAVVRGLNGWYACIRYR